MLPSSRDLCRLLTFGLRFLSLTCCSRFIITSTASLRIPSLVCGLSDFRCDIQIRPSSFSASFISRIRILSRALLALRRSLSFSNFCSGFSLSSSSSSSSSDLRFLFPRLPDMAEAVLGVGEQLLAVSLNRRFRSLGCRSTLEFVWYSSL